MKRSRHEMESNDTKSVNNNAKFPFAFRKRLRRSRRRQSTLKGSAITILFGDKVTPN